MLTYLGLSPVMWSLVLAVFIGISFRSPGVRRSLALFGLVLAMAFLVVVILIEGLVFRTGGTSGPSRVPLRLPSTFRR